jgi:hypothetical protein
MLEAYSKQSEKIWLARGYERLQGHAKTLGETRKEIEGYDQEGFIGFVEVGVLLIGLVLQQGMVNYAVTAFEHGGNIRLKSWAYGDGY